MAILDEATKTLEIARAGAECRASGLHQQSAGSDCVMADAYPKDSFAAEVA
jgi:hypothetical protein